MSKFRKQHMSIDWHEIVGEENYEPAVNEPFLLSAEKYIFIITLFEDFVNWFNSCN